MSQPREPVQDYTMPFLVVACVIVFMGLITLWATFNFAMSLISGWIIHRCISRFPLRN